MGGGVSRVAVRLRCGGRANEDARQRVREDGAPARCAPLPDRAASLAGRPPLHPTAAFTLATTISTATRL